MKLLFTLLFLLFFVLSSNAQSLHGNMNTVLEGEKVVLKFGNVDIYKEEKLVKTVLTDELGNFKVKLDTGVYKCVVNYDGYAPVTKMITVRGEEKADFAFAESEAGKAKLLKSISKDLEYKASAVASSTVESRFSSAPLSSGSYDIGKKYSEFIASRTSGFGVLTAGEINDFSKWSLWKGYEKGEFSTTSKNWDLFPRGRYTVQLQNHDGLPIADAKVSLINNRKAIFTARTDNTGKAELWLTIKNENPEISGKLSIEIEKNGVKEKIDHIELFEKGINHATLKINCQQSQLVDIAFVFDATGSMGDELRFLQNEIKQIIFDSKKVDDRLNFRFANVFYRDKGDTYVSKKMDFTRVLTAANAYIDEQSAGGGGDTPEAVEIALEMALTELEWSTDARARLLFLLLDAPPHQTPEIKDKLEKFIRIAAEKGIRIIPIGASGMNKDTEYLMRILALGTNGTYTFLTNHSGIGNTHLAPMTDRYDVETLNELMVRIIKSYTFMPDCQSQIQDPQLPYPDSAVQYPFINTHTDSLDSTFVDTVRFNPRDTSDNITINWNYYPNPTRGIVNVVVDRDVDALYITDIMGKEIMVLKYIYKDRPAQFDLSAYPTGMYLIRYPIGNKWITGKIVLHRY